MTTDYDAKIAALEKRIDDLQKSYIAQCDRQYEVDIGLSKNIETIISVLASLKERIG